MKISGPENMDDFEYLKQVGIEIPKQIKLKKQDWHDFYTTLSAFKIRVMKRHGYDPTDIFSPSTGRLISSRLKRR